MNYNAFLTTALDELKQDGRYRYFTPIEMDRTIFPNAWWHSPEGKRQITIWCSNDYMGMARNSTVIHQAAESMLVFGVGSGGTRNISGTNQVHKLLETELADFHKKESALLFTSGYIANHAVITTLAERLPDCHILSDENNHASIIKGIRHSRASKSIFLHNDLKDLETRLKHLPLEMPKLIIFESVYSMEGDHAPIEAFIDLAKTYNALTMVDEVHAVGIYGSQGAGLTSLSEKANGVDIITANMSKGLGVFGGYMAASQLMTDFVRSFASDFIFTTSLPPALAVAGMASIRYVRAHPELRKTFFDNVAYLQGKLRLAGFRFPETSVHITPVIVGEANLCRQVSKILLEEFGIYAQPINYPTVPVGTERLRITITPKHTHEMIDYFVESLMQVFDRVGLPRTPQNATPVYEAALRAS